jgi:hypothetical protein
MISKPWNTVTANSVQLLVQRASEGQFWSHNGDSHEHGKVRQVLESKEQLATSLVPRHDETKVIDADDQLLLTLDKLRGGSTHIAQQWEKCCGSRTVEDRGCWKMPTCLNTP